MKISRLLGLSILAMMTTAVAAEKPPVIAVALQNETPGSKAREVQRYQDILAQIPAEMRSTSPRAWTQIQREEVNTAFKDAFIDKETPAELQLKVADIADWGGWTFYANMPNREGYPIRVFGKFDDEWKARFTALKKGDAVVLKGVLSFVSYRTLWGKFTLSICLKDCTFSRLASSNKPDLKL